MKRFLYKFLQLSILPFILICLSLIIFKYKAQSIKLDESTSIVIAGDSHTHSALNDQIIDNSLNISQTSQHFLYTYNVLKLLLNNEQNVEQVILGVSFHSFSKFYDQYIHEDEKVDVMLRRYFSILDLESISDINKLPLNQLSGIYKNMLSELAIDSEDNASLRKYSFIGGFYSSPRSNLNDSTIQTTIKSHFLTEYHKEEQYSEFQEKYFQKIVELCQDKHVDLIVVNTPIHRDYLNLIPQNFIAHYYETLEQFGDEFLFYDFHKVDYPDNFFGDGDHLNALGAERFSLQLRETLKKGV